MLENQAQLFPKINLLAQQIYNDWLKKLDISYAAAGGDSTRLGKEFKSTILTWKERKEIFNERMTFFSRQITLKNLEDLRAILPPGSEEVCYHLEKVTDFYEESVFSLGHDTAELYLRGEAACDRDDFDIGINVLEQLSKREPRFFPILLSLGYAELYHRKNIRQALVYLNRAMSTPTFLATKHYYLITLQLISLAHERANQLVNAIQSCRQLRQVYPESPIVAYNVARLQVLNLQRPEALNSIETILRDHSSTFMLSLVDDDFRNLRQPLTDLVEEKTEVYANRARELISKLNRVTEIAETYNIIENNGNIIRMIDKLTAANLTLQENCYSSYLELFNKWLPPVIGAYPREVRHELTLFMNDRTEQIDKYNRNVEKRIQNDRNKILRIALPSWIVVGTLITLILVLANVSSWSAGSSGVMFLFLAIVPYGVLDSRFKRRYDEEKMDNTDLMDIREDITTLASISNDLSAKVNRDGWLM